MARLTPYFLVLISVIPLSIGEPMMAIFLILFAIFTKLVIDKPSE